MWQILFTILVSSLLLGCVSKKQYNEVALVRAYLENENADLKDLRPKNKELSDRLKKTTAQWNKAEIKLSEIKESYRNIEQNYAILLSRYDNVLSQSNQLIVNTSGEKGVLSEKLEAKQQKIDRLTRTVNTLKADWQKRPNNVDNTVGVQQKRDSLLQELVLELEDVLIQVAENGITIRKDHDQLNIALNHDLIHKKGSLNFTPKGIKILYELSTFLQKYPDLKIDIIGHTDSNESDASSWNLSTGRASTAAKNLTINKISPPRIVVIGKGKYDPLVPNTSKKNKALNRRTEIIIY